MDNLSTWDRALIDAPGAELRFLPPGSPCFSPIESAFAKLDALLRMAPERTVDGLRAAFGRIVGPFSPAECARQVSACGYDPDCQLPR